MNEIVNIIQKCCISIHEIVAKAPLDGHHGDQGHSNHSNDVVQKLDIIANHLLVQHLSKHPDVYSISSEELDHELILSKNNKKYRVVFDPLDGSSNINAGIPTGTIWGIEDVTKNEMIRAGYAMYSSSLYFCDAYEKGVILYVYNYETKQFERCDEILYHTKKVKQYSFNESNNLKWNPKLNDYLTLLKESGYTQRWIGTMVADVHRTILYGGVFCYPEDSKSKHGKLRLVYECRPFAFIFEKLGKVAINTSTLQPILEMEVKETHQKCGIILGDSSLVNDFIRIVSKQSKL
jgi:fructose-1,6-bisphosphatase I